MNQKQYKIMAIKFKYLYFILNKLIYLNSDIIYLNSDIIYLKILKYILWIDLKNYF